MVIGILFLPLDFPSGGEKCHPTAVLRFSATHFGRKIARL